MIKGSGFRFFSNRQALEHEFPTLGKRLSSISEADAILVLGHKFYAAGENTHAIKRLILPDPDSTSFTFYSKSLDQKNNKQIIEEAARKAKSFGTKVRMCPQFLGQSVVLADTAKPTGWAHIELVMPYSRQGERPSFTLEKTRFAEAVNEAQRTFNELWDCLGQMEQNKSLVS